MREVIDLECYAHNKLGFRPKSGEHWLDLGANIGSFSFWCMLQGAHTTTYEPDPINYKILCKNVPNSNHNNSAVTVYKNPTMGFYCGTMPGDYYRASIMPPITLREMHHYMNLSAETLCNSAPQGGYAGVKMDIEGAELAMIDQKLIPPCDRLVMEYHLSHDNNMAHFRKRIKILRSLFKTVYYIESLDQQYPNDRYPGLYDRFIWCLEPKRRSV